MAAQSAKANAVIDSEKPWPTKSIETQGLTMPVPSTATTTAG
jgi:hypothetical protein